MRSMKKICCFIAITAMLLGNTLAVYADDEPVEPSEEQQLEQDNEGDTDPDDENYDYSDDDSEYDTDSGNVDTSDADYPYASIINKPVVTDDDPVEEDVMPGIDADSDDGAEDDAIGEDDDILEPDDESGVSPSGTKITLDHHNITLNHNMMFELVATVTPSTSMGNLTWTSTSDSTASIMFKQGLSAYVKAAGYGTATIRATTSDGGAYDECKITIPEDVHVTSVKLNKTSVSLKIGETVQLEETVLPVNAVDKSVTWSSDDDNIATVTDTGLVKAEAPGTTYINVVSDDEGKSARCKIVVKDPVAVTGIKMNTTTLKTSKGKKITLYATISPSNAENTNIIWTTGDDKVATLEKTSSATRENNIITIVGYGEVTITAESEDGGFTATCEILSDTVHVSRVSFNKSSVSLKPGSSVQIKETVTPSTANDKTVTWASDDTSVATVTSSGLVRAVSPGVAYITATSNDGGKTAKCKVTVPEPVKVTGVKLGTTKKTITGKGQSFKITASISPSKSENKNVTWSVSNASVARLARTSGLSTDGNNVEIIGYGEATITVKTADGGYTAECKIVANPVKVSGIKLNKTSISLGKNESFQLTATVTPEGAENKGVTWASSDPSIASVSSTGAVKGLKAGTATITATASDGSGKKATCKVKVGATKATSVKLNKSTASIDKGKTVTLTATVSPSTADNKDVKWTSSSSSIASVSTSGVVTGKKAGKATITATTKDGSKQKATCTVTVVDKNVKVTGVKLNKKTASIKKGDTITLKATISPSNASNKNVTWKSSSTSVATVSSAGVVTGKKAGTATITVTTKDGSKKATCKVTVSKTSGAKETKVTSVKLNKSSATIKIGVKETLTLKATVSPSNATNKDVSWKSSNTSVATVSSSGVVTAKKAGKATITATAKDGSGKKATCKVTVKMIIKAY